MAVTRHQYRIYIKAPIEQVWNALLDPVYTRRYFHGTAFDQPPKSGKPYTTSTSDGHAAVDGTIEVIEPPTRLVMTWHTLYDASMAAEPPSRVEWTLAAAGEGMTQVDLIHGDLARSPLTWATVRHGWIWILDGLKTLLETGEELPAINAAAAEDVLGDDVAGDWHRAQGVECHNTTWELIEGERSPENDDEMLRRAWSSSYHWGRAKGRGPANDARGEWLLAKCHLIAGLHERSLHHADLCMSVCKEHGLEDFDLAYAHEARARALRAIGREEEAMEAWAAAKAVPIADKEDREILEADLAVGP